MEVKKLCDTLAKLDAEALIDRLIPETPERLVEDEKVSNTLVKVEAKTLVDGFADTLAEMEVKTYGDPLDVV